jgi:hypothetical protein
MTHVTRGPAALAQMVGSKPPAIQASKNPVGVAMPSRLPSRLVDLGPALKSRPEKARMTRAGIVAPAERAPMRGVHAVNDADGFQAPPNGGITDNHGGAVAPNVPVRFYMGDEGRRLPGARALASKSARTSVVGRRSSRAGKGRRFAGGRRADPSRPRGMGRAAA